MSLECLQLQGSWIYDHSEKESNYSQFIFLQSTSFCRLLGRSDRRCSDCYTSVNMFKNRLDRCNEWGNWKASAYKAQRVASRLWCHHAAEQSVATTRQLWYTWRVGASAWGRRRSTRRTVDVVEGITAQVFNDYYASISYDRSCLNWNTILALIVNFEWNACKKWMSSLKSVVILSSMSLHWNCAKIFKYSDIQYTTLIPDKTLNSLIYRTLFYVNI